MRLSIRQKITLSIALPVAVVDLLLLGLGLLKLQREARASVRERRSGKARYYAAISSTPG